MSSRTYQQEVQEKEGRREAEEVEGTGPEAAIPSRRSHRHCSLTDEQMAFQRRKHRTFFDHFDLDRDGLLTTSDFEIIVSRTMELTGITGDHAQRVHHEWMLFAKEAGVRPGVRLNWKFFSPYMAVTVNRPDQKRNTLDKMALIFDAVDTNEDGLISQEEFEVFYKCLGLSQSVAKESFKAIDTDSNGFISKPELLKAYEEFLWGVDENAPGNMFFGPLIDYI